MKRVWSDTAARGVIVLALAACGALCACRAGFGDPCGAGDCSGHGDCIRHGDGTASCECHWGYGNDGPMACVPEPWRDSCLESIDCDDSLTETDQDCGPSGDCSLLLCLGCGSQPDRWSLWQRLSPADWDATAGAGGSGFGSAVALEGNLLLVGAPYAQSDTTGAATGAAHLYVQDSGTWWPKHRIVPEDGLAGDGFGSEVALSGEWLFVGAPDADGVAEDEGAVYVFTTATRGLPLTFVARLSVECLRCHFGKSLAVDGDLLVVGSTHHVFLYRIANGAWTQVAELQEEDAHRFGFDVALEGDTLAVSDDWYPARGSDSGAVFVYTTQDRITWTLEQQLTERDTLIHDTGLFGASMALRGDTLLVGSPATTYEGHNWIGGLHLFQKLQGRWQERQWFWIPGEEFFMWDYHRLGRAVALQAGEVFGGAPTGRDPGGIEAGNVVHYRLEEPSWIRASKLYAPETGGLDEFGGALAVEADTLVIGAPGDDLDSGDAGGVYVYRR